MLTEVELLVLSLLALLNPKDGVVEGFAAALPKENGEPLMALLRPKFEVIDSDANKSFFPWSRAGLSSIMSFVSI